LKLRGLRSVNKRCKNSRGYGSPAVSTSELVRS
jgi:hypothetical protein